MGLGRSSRMSRKGDLIIRINLARSVRGMALAEILAQAKKLWRCKVDEVAEIYRQELITHTDWTNDPKAKGPPWEKHTRNA